MTTVIQLPLGGDDRGPRAYRVADVEKWRRKLGRARSAAPSRQRDLYTRVMALGKIMGDDGWLSQPAERVRATMGRKLPARTAEWTLAWAARTGWLRHDVEGGHNHQAVYRTTAPLPAKKPATRTYEVVDRDTGEIQPPVRRRLKAAPVPEVRPAPAVAQVIDLPDTIPWSSTVADLDDMRELLRDGLARVDPAALQRTAVHTQELLRRFATSPAIGAYIAETFDRVRSVAGGGTVFEESMQQIRAAAAGNAERFGRAAVTVRAATAAGGGRGGGPTWIGPTTSAGGSPAEQ